jgi:hypothetical protein
MLIPALPRRFHAAAPPVLAGLLLALCVLPLAGQVNPNIVPYRTIEVQQIRPNMQLVVDRSGSMSLDMNGNCRDGLPPPSCSDFNCPNGGDERCCSTYHVANCYGTPSLGAGPEFTDGRWTCQVCSNNHSKWTWVGPSRLAILKNVLGASLSTLDFLAIPVTGCNTDAGTDDCDSGGTPSTGGPGKVCNKCGGTLRPDLDASLTNDPITIAPGQVIDKNAIRVNIGLENFAAYGNSYNANQRVTMDASVNSTMCGVIPQEAAWADLWLMDKDNPAVTLCGRTISGLTPLRGTPTVAGLNLSMLVHAAVASGNSQTRDICPTDGSSSVTIASPTPGAEDPQRVCNRPMFNLLLTDGQSNNCNTASGNDSDITYAACPVSTLVAPVGSPSEVTDKLYNNGLNSGNNVSVRTLVIGISTDLSNANAKQELQLNAYFGRTDQADPYTLAGLKLTQAYSAAGNPISGTNYPADPYLRLNNQWVLADAVNSSVAGVTCTILAGKPKICNGLGYVCTHQYNFSATSSAQLSAALKSAFDAVASGDYTTETPSIAQAVTAGGATAQDLIYTASSEFPSYQGHLRAQDLNQCVDALGSPILCSLPGALGFKVIFDAGAQMNSVATSTRKIFTANLTAALNDTSTTTTYTYMTLVPVTTTNLTTIQNIYETVTGVVGSGTAITAPMIQFLRGQDPKKVGVPDRVWKLGDVINSSPVVMAPPSNFRLGSTVNHGSYVSAYNVRRPLVLMGASDGMVHAFDAGLGYEVWAFVPPDALPNILQEYNNYAAAGSTLTMGQTTDTATHVFGVASAINVGDVDLNAPDNTAGCTGSATTTCVSNWRTIAVTGMGKGGKAVFALDVTSSFAGGTFNIPNTSPVTTLTLPDDPTLSSYTGATGNGGAPFKLLWYKNANSAGFTDLGETWSSPAISLDGEVNGASPPVVGRWIVTFGSGPNGSSGNSGYTRGVHFHAVSARDGSAVGSATKLGSTDSSALIAASMKATNATYSTQTINFADQVVDKSYQGDLAGRMWEVDITNSSPASWSNGVIWPCATGSSAACTAASSSGTAQPIYNSPAIGFYNDAYATAAADKFRRISIHAWASGEFTETRPEVNDLLCGTGGTHPACFVENMYVSLFDYQPLAPASAISLFGRYTTTIPLAGNTYQRSATDTTLSTYSNKARILGSPSIFIPVIMAEDNKTVAIWPLARDITILYTAYDPTQGGCSGESTFILIKPCGANNSCTTGGAYNAAAFTYAQFASTGVASSPIVYKGQIIMNVSSKYSYAAARIAGLNAFTTGSTSDDPILGAWREVF